MTEALLPIVSHIPKFVQSYVISLLKATSVPAAFQHKGHSSDLIFGGLRTRPSSAATVDLYVFVTPPLGYFHVGALTNINASLVTLSSGILDTSPHFS